MPAVFQFYCNPLTDSRVASDWQISHIWLTDEPASDWQKSWLWLTDKPHLTDRRVDFYWQLSCLWLTWVASDWQLSCLWLTVGLPCLWLTVELPRPWQLSCLWLTVWVASDWQLSCLWLTVELTLTDKSWLWLTAELTSSDRWSCLYEHVSLDKPAGCPSSSVMQVEIVSMPNCKTMIKCLRSVQFQARVRAHVRLFAPLV